MNFDPWIISVLALILSFCSFLLGFFNYCRSSQFRDKDIKRQEFNSRVAAPIEAALNELGVTAGDLMSFRRSNRGLSDQKIEIAALGEKVSEKYQQLVGTLERADRNHQTGGNDWGQIAEPYYDKFLTAINTATEEKAPIESLRRGAELALTSIADISRVIEERISQEIKSHLS